MDLRMSRAERRIRQAASIRMKANSIYEEDARSVLSRELPWEDLSGATILVTGAGGLLASALVDVLLWAGVRELAEPVTVLAMVRNAGRARRRFARWEGVPQLKFIEQDVCDPLRVPGAVDYVIHAASPASPRQYGSDPVGAFAANVQGTGNLLMLARDRGVRGFLYFSSSEVYGKMEVGQSAIREDQFGHLDPTLVRSCYGEGKRAGETLSCAWAHQFGVPVKIVRPFHTYGPGMRADDGRVFADFVADVVAGRDIVMRSDGRAVRAYCYLSDAVAGFLTVLLRGRVGAAYNIGNDEALASVGELAEMLVGMFPGKRLRVVRAEEAPGYTPGAVDRSCPDITRARGLGWEPLMGIREGFRRTVESYG